MTHRPLCATGSEHRWRFEQWYSHGATATTSVYNCNKCMTRVMVTSQRARVAKSLPKAKLKKMGQLALRKS